ncbi:ABC transporter permease [Clostridium sp. AM58-1XD]|uniref:ABC transporter permease n=1 Tax=Clostridium sp. AM58-1XD TaxID=2292307 RepID=UPI00268636BE
MNIFSKIALQSMKKSRVRTAVTVTGVILSTAMITAVSVFVVSLQNYVVNGAIVKYGGWHAAFLDASPTFIQERSHDIEAAETASFENIGYAVLKGGNNPGKPYLFIAGFNKETFDTLPIRLISGRLPENSKEILVPAHVAANGGVKISTGSTISLSVGNRMSGNEVLSQHTPYTGINGSGASKEILVPKMRKTYTVVGICERPPFEEYTAPGYTMITMAEKSGRADSYSVFVTLKNPRKVHTYAASLAESRNYAFNDEVLRFMGLSDDRIFNTLLYSVGGILTALIMLGSIFLIYNSFSISLNDRIRQFGILMSIGATKRQLRNSVLFEGLCIGAVGIPAEF